MVSGKSSSEVNESDDQRLIREEGQLKTADLAEAEKLIGNIFQHGGRVFEVMYVFYEPKSKQF